MDNSFEHPTFDQHDDSLENEWNDEEMERIYQDIKKLDDFQLEMVMGEIQKLLKEREKQEKESANPIDEKIRNERVQRAEQIRSLKGEARQERVRQLAIKREEYRTKFSQLVSKWNAEAEASIAGPAKEFMELMRKQREEFDNIENEYQSLLGELEILENEPEE